MLYLGYQGFRPVMSKDARTEPPFAKCNHGNSDCVVALGLKFAAAVEESIKSWLPYPQGRGHITT